MIITDIQDLFIELHKTESYSQIARKFGKKRRWASDRKWVNEFTVTPEFVAGLKEYGYELKLVKVERKCKWKNL